MRIYLEQNPEYHWQTMRAMIHTGRLKRRDHFNRYGIPILSHGRDTKMGYPRHEHPLNCTYHCLYENSRVLAVDEIHNVRECIQIGKRYAALLVQDDPLPLHVTYSGLVLLIQQRSAKLFRMTRWDKEDGLIRGWTEKDPYRDSSA